MIGLDGTGGKSLFTQQVAVDMLQKLSASSKTIADLKNDPIFTSGNISAVMVTAEIGPLARWGSRLDVTVSIIDDASSLQGGTLLLTPLKGADGVTYAVAQGAISVGGFSFSDKDASTQKHHPTIGQIAGGAMVELQPPGDFPGNGHRRMLLKKSDDTTAHARGREVRKSHTRHARRLPPAGSRWQSSSIRDRRPKARPSRHK